MILYFDPQLTVKEFKKKFHAAKRKFYPSRQRFTLPLKAGETRATALEDSKKLSDFGLKDGSIVHFKDLGPQVRWGFDGSMSACMHGEEGCGMDQDQHDVRMLATLHMTDLCIAGPCGPHGNLNCLP